MTQHFEKKSCTDNLKQLMCNHHLLTLKYRSHIVNTTTLTGSPLLVVDNYKCTRSMLEICQQRKGTISATSGNGYNKRKFRSYRIV